MTWCGKQAIQLLCFVSVFGSIASAYTHGMAYSRRNVHVNRQVADSRPTRVTTTNRQTGGNLFAQEGQEVTKTEDRSWPVLSRSHERAIFFFYAVGGTALSLFSHKKGIVEIGLATTWASFVLAISFMEAWVKFKAPFLAKYIAVDVGRHVFAALEAAELGMCGSLWFSYSQSALPNGFSFRQSRFVLLMVATASLLGEALFVAPRLYLRAKARITEGIRDLPSNVKDALLNKEQEQELNKISREVDERKDTMPSKRWHSLYGILELLKVIVLNMFVVLSWKELA